MSQSEQTLYKTGRFLCAYGKFEICFEEGHQSSVLDLLVLDLFPTLDPASGGWTSWGSWSLPGRDKPSCSVLKKNSFEKGQGAILKNISFEEGRGVVLKTVRPVLKGSL